MFLLFLVEAASLTPMVPFTRECNRSTSFRICSKSGTLKGCIQKGNSSNRTVPFQKVERLKSDTKQAIGKQVTERIAFPSERQAILVRNRSVPM